MIVELDSKAFKVLSSDSRVALLKKVAEKPRSLSALAQEMGLTVQSTDEHLRKLQASGFVSKSRHSKWVYYEATDSGKQVVQPKPQAIYLMLSLSFFMFMAAFATLMFPSSVGLQEKSFQEQKLPPNDIQGAQPQFRQAEALSAESSLGDSTKAVESSPSSLRDLAKTPASKETTTTGISPVTLALLTTGLFALLFAAWFWYRSKK